MRSAGTGERGVPHFDKVVVMVIYTIKADSSGMWCICRGRAHLFNRLSLGQAMTQARRLARDQHSRTGWPTAVEMVGPEGTTRLSQYAKPGTVSTPEVA